MSANTNPVSRIHVAFIKEGIAPLSAISNPLRRWSACRNFLVRRYGHIRRDSIHDAMRWNIFVAQRQSANNGVITDGDSLDNLCSRVDGHIIAEMRQLWGLDTDNRDSVVNGRVSPYDGACAYRHVDRMW